MESNIKLKSEDYLVEGQAFGCGLGEIKGISDQRLSLLYLAFATNIHCRAIRHASRRWEIRRASASDTTFSTSDAVELASWRPERRPREPRAYS